MKKAILIDANSLAYRAFYALPDTMKSPDGFQTNAVYGFVSMLLKILETKCDFVATAFDRKEATFRHKEFAEYKGTRAKTPTTLIDQMKVIKEILELAGIPVLEKSGFEADDIIGTLAKRGEAEGFEVVIYSGDMDPLQLLTDKIKLASTKKGISDITIYDRDEVVKKYGLEPSQMIDLKSLKGDSSDNIPGISGFGEKTALSLIQEFGTLENLIANKDKISKPRTRELFEKGIDSAILSKMLGTIKTDVDIDADLNQPITPNFENCIEIFQKLGFNSIIKKLSPIAFTESNNKPQADMVFQIITNESSEHLLKEIEENKSFAFYINKNEEELLEISISYGEDNFHTKDFLAFKKVFEKLFQDDKITKIGYNIKESINLLHNSDIKLVAPYFDIMIGAYVLDPASQNYSIENIAEKYAHISIEKKEVLEPKDLVLRSHAIFELSDVLQVKIKENNLSNILYDIEFPLIEVLAGIEENGVFVDHHKLASLSKEIDVDIKNLEREIFAMAGETFNLNSPKQLGEILFNKLKLPVIKKTKTGISTDVEVLETLAKDFEIAKKLLTYRGIAKIKSTYVDALPNLISAKTGRIHANFNQTGTATGRLSSSNPNMQNIPIKSELGKKIREAFIPQHSGWEILSADYSQVELRVFASLSGDEGLIKAFKDGLDIHTATASEIFGVPLEDVTSQLRSNAKAVNFGIVYGISDYGLARNLGIKKSEASDFIQKYFAKYPKVKEFMNKIIEDCRRDGYVLTLLGRKREIPEINSHNQGLKGFAERSAINTVIQGTAADMIKVAMISIYKKCQIKNDKTCPASLAGCQMIMQVHDELVFEVPSDEIPSISKIVKEEMESAIKLDLPIVVEIGSGSSWAVA